MTSEQRDILIEKMIDKPDSLTNDEIALISLDIELRELYEISSRLTDELTPVPEVNIDTEWSKMEGLIGAKKPRRRFKFSWIGVAAAITGLLICGAFATKYIISGNIDTKGGTPYIAKVVEPDNELPLSEAKEEVELQSVKGEQLPARSHVIVPANVDTSKTDIEEYLRIEQARVDNEVAMVLAQVYQEDYDVDLEELAEWLDSLPEDSLNIITPHINGININQLTML